MLQLEPCRQILAEAQRQSEGRDRRGRNPDSASSTTTASWSPYSEAATPSP
ncbi:hypothetical protein [Streptomyces sp. NPDC059970]|uniref:hypothetical protein n=1 Tax=Streptomyces sp. NPDC059970 TaxID=3347019 RepID=UPI003699A7A9